MSKKYLIVDITRTLNTGKKMYWKYNDYGYTENIKEAKQFYFDDALKHIDKPYCDDLAIIQYIYK